MYHRKATTERLSGNERQHETSESERRKRRCLFLRDFSAMETEMENVEKPEIDGRGDHVTSGGSGMCADDVNVLDVIETCHGVRPFLLSQHFVDRRQSIFGIHSVTYLFILSFIILSGVL